MRVPIFTVRNTSRWTLGSFRQNNTQLPRPCIPRVGASRGYRRPEEPVASASSMHDDTTDKPISREEMLSAIYTYKLIESVCRNKLHVQSR